MTYEAARNALAQHLLLDAEAHEAGRFDQIGRRFDSFEHAFPGGNDPLLAKLRVALTFWDAWIDARNHEWQPTADIQRAEWPSLARDVAGDLAADRDITSERVRQRFDVDGRAGLGGRALGVTERLRGRAGSI